MAGNTRTMRHTRAGRLSTISRHSQRHYANPAPDQGFYGRVTDNQAACQRGNQAANNQLLSRSSCLLINSQRESSKKCCLLAIVLLDQLTAYLFVKLQAFQVVIGATRSSSCNPRIPPNLGRNYVLYPFSILLPSIYTQHSLLIQMLVTLPLVLAPPSLFENAPLIRMRLLPGVTG